MFSSSCMIHKRTLDWLQLFCRSHFDSTRIRWYLYTWGACSVGMFCFVSEVPVINWAAQLLQYQPNSRWNMSKMIYKTSRLSGRLIVYTSRRGTEYILQSTLSFRRVSYHSRTNCKDSNSWNHFWACRHLFFFKEGKFGVVWALGGSNSN